MANRTTPTQREFFNEIIALAKANDRNDIVEFAKARIDALDKKSGKVNAKKVAEVEGNTSAVLSALATLDKPVTVSELIKESVGTDVATWSNQKVSAYLTKLVNAGKVVKTTDKKISRFTVA